MANKSYPTLTPGDAAGNLAAVLNFYPLEDPSSAPDDPERFCLVEQSTHSSSHWVTCHASRRAAAEYHEAQEYPEDWPVQVLFDLEKGKAYYPVERITFHPLSDE